MPTQRSAMLDDQVEECVDGVQPATLNTDLPKGLSNDGRVRARDDFGVEEVFLPYRSLIVAVETAAAATSTPDFGRRLALRQGIEILGPLGVAART
ncbi:MAG TPA: hypothetical protein VGI68_17485, partial [Mycobacterium sp.]